MSTEQKPPATTHNEPKHEPNALSQVLAGGWEKFKQGKLISYPMMAIILLVVTAIGVTWWIVHERRKTQSAMWVELDALSSPSGLEDYAKKNPNTLQAKLAMLEIARMQLGPEGIDRLSATDPAARKAAIESIEKAREAFPKLVDEFKDDPVIRVECMLASAKAEAILVGIPKEGKRLDPLDPKPIAPGDSRGDPAKVIEWLDKVFEAAPDTDWGKDAKKFADVLRNLNTQQQVVKLQTDLYGGPSVPDPKLDPRMPLDPTHGFPGPPGPP